MLNKNWQDMITNVQVFGVKESMIASGYPMLKTDKEIDLTRELNGKDVGRAHSLGKVKSGTGHDTYLRGCIIQFDIKYPVYFSPQFQRYSFIDIVSSMSAMHKLVEMDLDEVLPDDRIDSRIKDIIRNLIEQYKIETDKDKKKELFDKIINNTPQGLMKTMRCSTNYLQLKTIYQQRRHHKLDEWQMFCDWIEQLDNFKLLCLGE